MTDARDPTFNGMPDVCFFLLVGHARLDLASCHPSSSFPSSSFSFEQEREREEGRTQAERTWFEEVSHESCARQIPKT